MPREREKKGLEMINKKVKETDGPGEIYLKGNFKKERRKRIANSHIWRSAVWENPHLDKNIKSHISEFSWALNRIHLKSTIRHTAF